MSDLFNVSEILELNELIKEVNEVIGTWEIYINDCPVNPLKIKVVKLYPQDRYMGIANHSIQSPGQSSPYRSLSQYSTPQEALEDAIMGFLKFYSPEVKDKTRFILDENF